MMYTDPVQLCAISIRHLEKTSSTVAPSSAGFKTLHWQPIPSSPNLSITLVAIASKLVVAKAKMVGPAPERQMPSKP